MHPLENEDVTHKCLFERVSKKFGSTGAWVCVLVCACSRMYVCVCVRACVRVRPLYLFQYSLISVCLLSLFLHVHILSFFPFLCTNAEDDTRA